MREPPCIGSDHIPLVLGPTGDLAVRNPHLPPDIAWAQAVGFQQVRGERHQLILAGDREYLEEWRHGPDLAIRCEGDVAGDATAADFTRPGVDDQRLRRDDAAETKHLRIIDLDRIVIERLVGRAEAPDGEGRKDSKGLDGGCGCHVRPSPSRPERQGFR